MHDLTQLSLVERLVVLKRQHDRLVVAQGHLGKETPDAVQSGR
ncbi:hypothetical protein ABIA40_001751 [Bradyrhizobium sp. USDA 223]